MMSQAQYQWKSHTKSHSHQVLNLLFSLFLPAHFTGAFMYMKVFAIGTDVAATHEASLHYCIIVHST